MCGTHVRNAALVASVSALLWQSTVATQEQAAGQPGLRWTEAQIREAVAPARVGRRLTPRSWPNGAKVAVCLSFDVDNESMARGETLPVPMSAGQYGAVTGLPRILRILDRHNVPASFYIPAASLV